MGGAVICRLKVEAASSRLHSFQSKIGRMPLLVAERAGLITQSNEHVRGAAVDFGLGRAVVVTLSFI